MQVPIESSDYGVLQVNKMLFGDFELPELENKACHASVGGLNWLFQLGRHECRDDCQFYKAGRRLVFDSQIYEVAVCETGSNEKRLLLVLLLVVQVFDKGYHVTASFSRYFQNIVFVVDIVAKCNFFL